MATLITKKNSTVGAVSHSQSSVPLFVVVYPDGTPATNRGTDDWEWDTAQFAVKTTNGSCTVYCIFTGKVKGNRKILYVIN